MTDLHKTVQHSSLMLLWKEEGTKVIKGLL